MKKNLHLNIMLSCLKEAEGKQDPESKGQVHGKGHMGLDHQNHQ